MSTLAEELIEVRTAYRRVCGQLAERDQEAHDLRQQNEELQGKVEALEGRLERMTRRTYGWSSERHHPDQQRIDLGLPEMLITAPTPADTDADATSASDTTPSAISSSATATDATTTTATTAEPSAPQRRPRAPGSHPGRRRLPASSEVVEQDLTVPEDERLGADGLPLPLLGWRTSDKWDYRPGIYLIRRFRRAIYGKPFSVAHDRIVADLPTMLIPGGAMTDAAVIHTVVDKFADHLPLYRQEARAGRCGFPLARATLVNHVAVVATALTPIVDALSDQVRQSRCIHLDDTPVRMLDPGRGHTATTRIWVYRSAAATVFRFSATREGRHPAEFLADYRGHIIADGYAGHERLYGLDKATHVACWAHARRKFSEIKERWLLACAVVEDIQQLYAVEKSVRSATDLDRHRARHARSRPILARIRERLDAAVVTCVPAGDLGTAIAYTRTRWTQLTRFLDHGWLPIDPPRGLAAARLA